MEAISHCDTFMPIATQEQRLCHTLRLLSQNVVTDSKLLLATMSRNISLRCKLEGYHLHVFFCNVSLLRCNYLKKLPRSNKVFFFSSASSRDCKLSSVSVSFNLF